MRRLLRKILRPPLWVVLTCALATILLMVWIFALGRGGRALTYPAYAFSAYSLAVVCIRLGRMSRAGLRRYIYRNNLLRRYFEDIPFRATVSLLRALALNLLYVLLKLGMGIYYRSGWFVLLGVYYLVLSVMRFQLLRRAKPETLGRDLGMEYRRYRACAVLLLLLNVLLSFIVLGVLRDHQSFDYAGSLIYAMAAYAFYAVIFSVINLLRYRKQGSPVVTASKVVTLAAALVSMLSLEIAMLLRFGEAESLFRAVMIGVTGGVVSLTLMGAAVYMLVRAGRYLRREGAGF